MKMVSFVIQNFVIVKIVKTLVKFKSNLLKKYKTIASVILSVKKNIVIALKKVSFVQSNASVVTNVRIWIVKFYNKNYKLFKNKRKSFKKDILEN